MIELAPADPASLPGIATLAAAVLDDAWSEAAFREELGLSGAQLLVGRDAGGGTVAFLAARRICDELHILSLGVDPTRRRQGVGRLLLESALAAEPGARVAWLEVRAGNEAALGFYAAMGFVAVGRRPRYYRGREDAILMERKL